jgi:hypothetical protein
MLGLSVKDNTGLFPSTPSSITQAATQGDAPALLQSFILTTSDQMDPSSLVSNTGVGDSCLTVIAECSHRPSITLQSKAQLPAVPDMWLMLWYVLVVPTWTLPPASSPLQLLCCALVARTWTWMACLVVMAPHIPATTGPGPGGCVRAGPRGHHPHTQAGPGDGQQQGVRAAGGSGHGGGSACQRWGCLSGRAGLPQGVLCVEACGSMPKSSGHETTDAWFHLWFQMKPGLCFICHMPMKHVADETDGRTDVQCTTACAGATAIHGQYGPPIDPVDLHYPAQYCS